jgi:aquaporin Z
MRDTLKCHYPEYLMEAAGLGLFMISAASFGTLLEHPASPIHQAIPNPDLRRLLMGLAMGLTAVALIYSPWGKQSGAHLNPAVTLTFLRLGKIAPADAFFYVLAQFAGGLTGLLLAATVLGSLLAHMNVHYVATVPGPAGSGPAFLVEVLIAFLLMTTVLAFSNQAKLAHATGLMAGCLVASYVILAGPISGFSMNPARTFASALPAHLWTALWIYFTAPPLGMLLGAECYVRLKGEGAVFCAKLDHHTNRRCIFHCRFAELASRKLENQKVETFESATGQTARATPMMFTMF